MAVRHRIIHEAFKSAWNDTSRIRIHTAPGNSRVTTHHWNCWNLLGKARSTWIRSRHRWRTHPPIAPRTIRTRHSRRARQSRCRRGRRAPRPISIPVLLHLLRTITSCVLTVSHRSLTIQPRRRPDIPSTEPTLFPRTLIQLSPQLRNLAPQPVNNLRLPDLRAVLRRRAIDALALETADDTGVTGNSAIALGGLVLSVVHSHSHSDLCPLVARSGGRSPCGDKAESYVL